MRKHLRLVKKSEGAFLLERACFETGFGIGIDFKFYFESSFGMVYEIYEIYGGNGYFEITILR